MTVTRRHNIYAVHLQGASPVVLPGVTSVNVRTESEVRSEPTGGQVYPEHTAMHQQEPMADFASLAISACLDEIALAGLDISSLTSGLSLYAYKHAKGASRSAGATHRKYNFTDGIVIPTSVSVDHRGDATINYELHSIYDGTNFPFTVADTEAVPTAPTDGERFGMGPVTIGSVAIAQKTRVEIDLGLTVERDSADGDKWPTHVSIVQGQPVITIRGIDVEWLKEAGGIPLAGSAPTHANTSVYFRKRAQGVQSSGYQTDVSTVHVKFTASGLAYIDDAFAGQNQSPAEASLILQCDYDGTNAPLVISTGVAVT